jgi:hypothetical protein
LLVSTSSIDMTGIRMARTAISSADSMSSRVMGGRPVGSKMTSIITSPS